MSNVGRITVGNANLERWVKAMADRGICPETTLVFPPRAYIESAWLTGKGSSVVTVLPPQYKRKWGSEEKGEGRDSQTRYPTTVIVLRAFGVIAHH